MPGHPKLLPMFFAGPKLYITTGRAPHSRTESDGASPMPRTGCYARLNPPAQSLPRAYRVGVMQVKQKYGTLKLVTFG